MTRFFLLVCSLLMTLGLGAQVITLEVDNSLVISSSTCTTIEPGETLFFERGTSCGGVVGISTDDGATFTALTETTPGSFEYTFASAGSYMVYCGAPPTDLSRAATSAFCVIVPDAVPTLGEWGLISLAFLLMIFSVVAIRNTSKKGSLDVA